MRNIWQLKPTVPDDFVKNNSEYNKIILQLLFNRRLLEKSEIELFFNPDKNELSDPFLFKDMKAAVPTKLQMARICEIKDAGGFATWGTAERVIPILKKLPYE